jgi:endonuclease G, mitochondrial
VKYSVRLKAPIITVVNIDGEHSVRIKRGADQWFTDGRIDRDIQLGSANFAAASIDRGHMVRREDPNWGDLAEAQFANDDTFPRERGRPAFQSEPRQDALAGA